MALLCEDILELEWFKEYLMFYEWFIKIGIRIRYRLENSLKGKWMWLRMGDRFVGIRRYVNEE